MQDIPANERRLFICTEVLDASEIKVSVRDFGPGVGSEHTDELFHPFFTTKSSGMGMGLSISKSIIKGHGGAIGFENLSDGGALFWFTLSITVKE